MSWICFYWYLFSSNKRSSFFSKSLVLYIWYANKTTWKFHLQFLLSLFVWYKISRIQQMNILYRRDWWDAVAPRAIRVSSHFMPAESPCRTFFKCQHHKICHLFEWTTFRSIANVHPQLVKMQVKHHLIVYFFIHRHVGA